MTKPFKDKKRTGIIIAIVAAIVILLGGLIGGCLYILETRTLPEDMMIAGVPVGNMTRKEALAALSDVQNNYREKDLLVTVDGQTLSLTPELTQIKVNMKAAVRAAFRQPEDTKAMDITPYMTIDETTIATDLQGFSKKFESALVESTYAIIGEKPDLTTHTVTGDGQTLVITKGKPDSSLDTERLFLAIVSCYNNGQFTLEFPLTSTPPKEPDWTSIYNEFCTQPVDAVMNMETFEVSNHSYGYAFDLEEAKKCYTAAGYGEEISIPFSPIAPSALHDDVKAILYRDVLGSYTARASSQYNRNINLKLSCQAINGKVLFPGQTISYNATLGKRTPEKGYRPATSYWGSEIITSYGGGICQASSCLYYAALIADLEIVERHNHGYVSSYMPLGMDATVDWSGPDLRIKNNTQYPVRIEAYASGGTVTVKLIGTDTKDYYVKMTYEVLSKTNYETVYVEMEEDNEKGYKDGEVISSPYTGYRVRTYKSKYEKETDKLISTKAVATSTYSKKDKEICKIIPKETLPPPTTTAPPETTTTPPETTETTSPGIGGNVNEDG